MSNTARIRQLDNGEAYEMLFKEQHEAYDCYNEIADEFCDYNPSVTPGQWGWVVRVEHPFHQVVDAGELDDRCYIMGQEEGH